MIYIDVYNMYYVNVALATANDLDVGFVCSQALSYINNNISSNLITNHRKSLRELSRPHKRHYIQSRQLKAQLVHLRWLM